MNEKGWEGGRKQGKETKSKRKERGVKISEVKDIRERYWKKGGGVVVRGKMCGGEREGLKEGENIGEGGRKRKKIRMVERWGGTNYGIIFEEKKKVDNAVGERKEKDKERKEEGKEKKSQKSQKSQKKIFW